jgi:hypothetical protein
MLIASGRKVETDRAIDQDQISTTFDNHQFVRLVAIRKTFKEVDFKHTTFDACYLRDCSFDSCDFTGCRFVATNLSGSKFSGCTFDYATFERTQVEADLLDTECPSRENLKARFARTLRTNFQQLGFADAANKAMKVELQATEIHLRKEWGSNESYFRKKYQGIRRVQSFLEWLKFKSLDFVWGNGESTYRLVRFVLIVWCLMALYDALQFGEPQQLKSYVDSFVAMPELFLGVSAPSTYAKWYVAMITLIRLILIGFFLAIIVKRFNRR